MKRIFTNPGTFFLVVGLVIGIAFSILTPFTTGFDEDVHLARIYDISGFNLIPNNSIYESSTVSFAEFYTLSYRRFQFRDHALDLFKPEYFSVRANYDSMDIKENASIYPPLMYFPQAIVAGICWRFLDLPIIPVSILLRITGLLVYLFISFLAIQTIPIGKWGLTVLALFPTALYQASTVNGDGYTNAVSFLFISMVLALILQDNLTLNSRRLLGLCTTVFLLGMAKPGAVILFLLVLLIPPRAYTSRKQAILLWSSVILMTLFHAAWILLMFSKVTAGIESVFGTTGTVLNQFSNYMRTFWTSLIFHSQQLFSSMIAAYGYWTGKVPAPVYWLVALVFLTTLILNGKQKVHSFKLRVSLFLIFLISWFGILFLYTSGKFSNNIGEEIFDMVQGRYLIAFLPLLFFSLFGLVDIPKFVQKIINFFVPAGTALYLILFFWGMFAHFYTPCGPFLMSRSTCRLPAYQNVDLENPSQLTLSAKTILEQEFTNTCKDIQSIEVLVTENSPATSGEIQFGLFSSSGQEIISSTYQADSISSKQYLVLDLRNLPIEIDQAYVIQINTTNFDGNLGLAVREKEAYPGILRVDKGQIVGDLIFFYSCAPAGLLGY